jgi:hypothetical protein
MNTQESNKVTFTTKEVQEMIMNAFIKGENWGSTYQGWFIPTKEEQANRAAKDCEYIYRNALIAKL